MSGFDFRLEWLEAPGVTTPELAGTWARYEIWVGDRCATQVEGAGGTFRRGVYGSLYPLAHWIATNWWALMSHIRPSATDTRYWDWQNVSTYPWLRKHNFRSAGDGMAWPNLTIVPEGAVGRVVWSQDYRHQLTPVRFASDGSRVLRADELARELAAIIDQVLERLADVGIPKTPLSEEWAAIAEADADEMAFCQTAGRLGLDPYAIDDETAQTIVRLASSLPTAVAADFFDTADANALARAADWALRAMSAANQAAADAEESLEMMYAALPGDPLDAADSERPWRLGYSIARRLRSELTVRDTDPFDVSPWVGIGAVDAPSHGIYGVASVTENRCGVVLGGQATGTTAMRFGRARALGRVLARPEHDQFVLSAARSQEEKVARAFAAELLAPAEGIRRILTELGSSDDSALEAVARHFEVSPLLARHQYDNQLTVRRARSNDMWLSPT
jgi:hypothetical protein